jgi:hypothetical protein
MTKDCLRLRLEIAFVLMGLLPAACQQTLRTGKAGNTRNAPNPDGTCQAGLTVCGKGAFAQCLDLQNDPSPCGTCDNACVPGIACETGICQQTVCTGATVPLSEEPNASVTATYTYYAYLVLADVNGDGYLDLVDYQRLGSIRVSLGQPGGGFATPVAYPSSDVLSISATDVNADGIDDLLVVSSATPSFPPSRVEVWLGHPDGRLTRANATDLWESESRTCPSESSPGISAPMWSSPSLMDKSRLGRTPVNDNESTLSVLAHPRCDGLRLWPNSSRDFPAGACLAHRGFQRWWNIRHLAAACRRQVPRRPLSMWERRCASLPRSKSVAGSLRRLRARVRPRARMPGRGLPAIPLQRGTELQGLGGQLDRR